MKQFQGTVFEIHKAASGGTTRTAFRLRAEDGTVANAETEIDFPWHEGDIVSVSGELDSDLVLKAATITPARQAHAVENKPRLYKARAVIAVLLAALVVPILLLVNYLISRWIGIKVLYQPEFTSLAGVVGCAMLLGRLMSPSDHKINARLSGKIAVCLWVAIYIWIQLAK